MPEDVWGSVGRARRSACCCSGDVGERDLWRRAKEGNLGEVGEVGFEEERDERGDVWWCSARTVVVRWACVVSAEGGGGRPASASKSSEGGGGERWPFVELPLMLRFAAAIWIALSEGNILARQRKHSPVP